MQNVCKNNEHWCKKTTTLHIVTAKKYKTTTPWSKTTTKLQEEMTARDASVYKIVRKMNTKSQKKKKLLQNDFKIMHDGLLKMQNNYQIIKVDNRITKTWRRKEYNRRERQLYWHLGM